jgi:hypothetical protein
MRCTIVFLSLVLFCGCTANKNVAPNSPAFAENWLKAKDPMDSFIADSLRYLIPVLDSVLISDQKYRSGINQKKGKELKKALKDISRHSEEIKAISQKNLETVTAILDKYGWLSYQQIGAKGYTAIFFVLQHADLHTQEKYFPLMKNALTEKKILPSHYAMISDRIELKNHRPQMYGTQVTITKNNQEVQPLLNADSVDVWRHSIGLDSLKNYLSIWHIKWDADSYKKNYNVESKKYEHPHHKN